MLHAVLTHALDTALALRGAGAVLVPQSGTGPITLLALVAPQPDEVVDFPELRGLLGAERPGWSLAIRQSDVAARPQAGDRLTVGTITYQLRGVQSDGRGYWWRLTGFVVEAAPVGGYLEPQIYMPCGAGFSTAASLQ